MWFQLCDHGISLKFRFFLLLLAVRTIFKPFLELGVETFIFIIVVDIISSATDFYFVIDFFSF